MRKVILILVFASAVALGAHGCGGDRTNQDANTPQTTETKVERGPIRLLVAATGRVVANLEVQIKCKASGEVINLPYDESDAVEKDALLVELDPVDEERGVRLAEVALSASQAHLAQANQSLVVAERTLVTDRQKAEAALRSAEAGVQYTKAKAARLSELLANQLTSQEEYDTAATEVIQAEADLESARSTVAELETGELALENRRQDVKLAEAEVESDRIDLSIASQRLKETRVVAPIRGVVGKREVQIGQIISSGISNVGGGTTVLTLLDLSRLFVVASVDESDIGRVRLDQMADITADAFPDKRFRGKVVRIAPMGENVSNVVTFEVEIEVLGDEKSLLKPEMTANVEIVVAGKKDALTLPVDAVFRGEDGKPMVTVVETDGATRGQPVELGITDGARQEIVAGLTQGMTVLVREGQGNSRWRRDGGPPMRGMMFPRGRGRR